MTMAHFVGKIDFNSLVGTKIAEVEMDGEITKCVLIPISANGIILWGDELQLWFRAFAYRQPKSRFTHCLMTVIPRQSIRKLSASQLEAFANHSIGGMIKTDNATQQQEPMDTADFIKENI